MHIFKPLVRLGIVVLMCVVGMHGPDKAFAASNDAPQTLASPDLSSNVLEVIRLGESGIDEDVIVAYIENSTTPFQLSADQIVYLRDLGIESSIITAMLRQDASLREQSIGPENVSTNRFSYDQKIFSSPTNFPSVVPQTVYVTNAPAQVVYFYDSLLPFGSWVDLEGYGWCWQPSVQLVDHSWRPYWQGGGWVYSDYGWYWRSDYSWGWAPFHYGRWHHHNRHGWLWFPDIVWAPAWVSWRWSDAYCGWAPLPPAAHFVVGHGWRFNGVNVGFDFDFHLGLDLFTFVEIGHVHDHHPHLHGVPFARAKDVYNRTTVHNDYAVGHNNQIINHGVSVKRVAAASGREIHPVTIKEDPRPRAGPGRPDRFAKEGSATVLYRSELKAPLRQGPFRAQRADERNPVVHPIPQRPDSKMTPRRPAPRSTPMSPQPSPFSKPAGNVPVTRAPTSGGSPGPGKFEQRATPPTAVPTRPFNSPSGSMPLPQARPAVPQRPAAPPPRFESPRGREQRLSNGSPLQRSPAPASRKPSSRMRQQGPEGK